MVSCIYFKDFLKDKGELGWLGSDCGLFVY